MKRGRVVLVLLAYCVTMLLPCVGPPAASAASTSKPGRRSKANPPLTKAASVSCKPAIRLINAMTGEADSFGGRFTVASTQTAMVVPGPLLNATATVDRVVPASAITATAVGPTTGTQAFNVVIAGISDPGTWTGVLTASAGGKSCTVTLTVIARARATLTAVQGDSVALAFSNTKPFSPSQHVNLVVRNNSEAHADTCPPPTLTSGQPCPTLPASPARVVVQLYSGTDGHVLSGITPPPDLSVAAGDAGTIRLGLDGSDLDAGHYTGFVRIQLWNNPPPQVIPVTADVKDGLFWPLMTIILALGVRLAAEFVAKYTPIGKAAVVKTKAARVKRRASKAPEPDRSIVRSRSDRVTRQLRNRQRNPSDALTEIETVEAAETALRDARVTEYGQAADADAGAVADAHNKLRQAAASESKEEITNKAQQLRLARAGSSHISHPADPGSEPTPDRSPILHRQTRFLGLGTLFIDAMTILVLAIGFLETTYFNDATFGANVLADYGALFIAGLGTAAAGKIISGIVTNAATPSDGS
jgi:hypothetical protein